MGPWLGPGPGLAPALALALALALAGWSGGEGGGRVGKGEVGSGRGRSGREGGGRVGKGGFAFGNEGGVFERLQQPTHSYVSGACTTAVASYLCIRAGGGAGVRGRACGSSVRWPGLGA